MNVNRQHKTIIALIFASLFHLNCKRENVNANALRELSDLATLEYTLTKIIKIVDKKFYGSRKILFRVDAKVKAGIDLSKVKTKVSGRSVDVEVPPAKMITLNIVPESIKEIYTEKSGLRFKFSKEEKLRILEQGEKDISKKIKEIGLLDQAKQRAHGVIRSWLYSAGFKEVNIKVRRNDKSNSES